MRKNSEEKPIDIISMEEYLKKRQAIRRRGNMGENECHEKTAAALRPAAVLLFQFDFTVLFFKAFNRIPNINKKLTIC